MNRTFLLSDSKGTLVLITPCGKFMQHLMLTCKVVSQVEVID